MTGTYEVGEPISDEDAMREALEDVETGDSLTVEWAGGRKRDERTVTFVERSGQIQWGEPQTGAYCVLDPERQTIHKLTDDAMDPLSVGRPIGALWVWGDE